MGKVTKPEVKAMYKKIKEHEKVTKHTTDGVYISTSGFTEPAKEFARQERVRKKLKLVG